MSSGIDFPLTFANQYADLYLADLMPFCVTGAIVGSVRRHKPVVHDIEFLVWPNAKPVLDLFQAQSGTYSLLDAALPELVKKWGAKVVKDGPAYKKLILAEGLPLDIFVSDEKRWGVEMVIRTGPADFSHRCVTTRQHAGYLPSNCQIKNGWQVYRNETLLPMPTEADFLNFLGLGWIEPEDRK